MNKNKPLVAIRVDDITEANLLIEVLSTYKTIKGNKMFSDKQVNNLLKEVYKIQKMFQEVSL